LFNPGLAQTVALPVGLDDMTSVGCPDPNEELVYEEKIDRITEQLEELILDALMAALGKIRERNELLGRLEKAPAENNPDF